MSDIDTTSTTSGRSSNSTSRLKKLTSSSTWVSPFRTPSSDAAASKEKKVNLVQKYKQSNSISGVKVPKKFASHPTLDAEAKKQKEKQAADKAEAEAPKNASVKSLKDEAGVEEDDKEGEEKTSADAEYEKDEDKENKTEDGINTKLESELKNDIEDAKATADEDKETHDAKVEETAKDIEAEELAAEKLESESKEPSAVDGADGEEDDNIVEETKENPIEIVTQPEAKYEPVELPNQKTLDALKDKPILLNRYNELNSAALGSVERTLDDPNKIIDLGSGLKMTQQQLLDIAAKRVAPVLSTLNEEVEKTRNEDEIKRQQELDNKAKAHEQKLQGQFDKHALKIGKKKESFNTEIKAKLDEIARLTTVADTEALEFEKKTKEEIETANKEFEEREAKAVENHETDKENLEKNHEELTATKKQELEESKANQEKTTQEIEELHEKKADFANLNSELSTKIEELEAQLAEKQKKLEELKTQHSDKQALIFNNLATQDELNKGLEQSNTDLEAKKSKHKALSAEIGVLGGTLAAYAAQLATLKLEKSDRTSKLADAKKKFADWENEKQELAKNVHLENERKRLQAKEDLETRQHEEELERQRQKAEAERLEKEKQEKEAADKAAADKAAADMAAKEEAEKKKREDEEAATAAAAAASGGAAGGAAGSSGAFLGKSNDLAGKPSEGAVANGKTLDPQVQQKTAPEVQQKSAAPAAIGTSSKSVEPEIDSKAAKPAEPKVDIKANKSAEDSKKEEEPKKKHSNKALAAGVGAGGLVVGAGAGVAAGVGSAGSSAGNAALNAAGNIGNGSSAPANTESKSASSNGQSKSAGSNDQPKSAGSNGSESNGLSSRFKKFGRRLSRSREASNESIPAKASAAEASNKEAKPKGLAETSGPSAVSISKQPEAIKNKNDSSSDYETYSIYEEVSDAEFAAHKDDPNYFECTAEELEKHRKRPDNLVPVN